MSNAIKQAIAERKAERMTRDQAAAYLGVKKATLNCWAVTGKYNLPFQRIGSRVFYLKSDLDAFIERRTRTFNDAA